MKILAFGASALAASLALAALTSAPAHALTSKECSAKYKAAKAAGTLNGMKYKDFRKAQCADAASAPPPSSSVGSAPAAKPSPKMKSASPMMKSAAPVGGAIFPSKISPKYANEKPGTARMHTCRDQYVANKGVNANGGLKWIQKGGGYYSECNKRLKG